MKDECNMIPQYRSSSNRVCTSDDFFHFSSAGAPSAVILLITLQLTPRLRL